MRREMQLASAQRALELGDAVATVAVGIQQRFKIGHALYKKGQEGKTFHIIAQGEVEVFRDGTKVAKLGAGTSVGEMAYLAPSDELRRHSTDVVVSLDVTFSQNEPVPAAVLGIVIVW